MALDLKLYMEKIELCHELDEVTGQKAGGRLLVSLIRDLTVYTTLNNKDKEDIEWVLNSYRDLTDPPQRDSGDPLQATG